MHYAVALLILAPFIGFLIHSFSKKNLYFSSFIGCSASFISFLTALYLFFNYSGTATKVSFFPWIQLNSLEVHFSFLIDSLSLMMVLIITGVGFLIHLFSVEYMSHDKRPALYFSYLNLFLFNMLVLVLADNLLLLFVGWEGVGLCSYLLIGFWYKDREKAIAGMKAFIVNRIGDTGFLIGMILFFMLFQSLDFLSIQNTSTIASSNLLTLTCLCLFIGAAGKSAQFPLYVWLPSAMAGPTPVSALIHAATMVTSGIYLIIRTMPLWEASPLALNVVAWVGVITALLGAYKACMAWDVKKILAYSTVSQLGYMFLALGVGAYASSFFHLITHAFFKACLFLAAGSLIHGLSGEQDIRKMGGLRKKMPVTFWSFFIGILSLVGIPPLSGFFSKDEILYNVFHQEYYGLWLCALLGVALTAFYSTKTLYYIFWRKTESTLKIHEGGWFIKIPLIILAFFSCIAGIFNWPHFMPAFVEYQWLGHWINTLKETSSHESIQELLLALFSTIFVISVVLVTVYCLVKKKKIIWLSSIFQIPWSLNNFYNQNIVKSTLYLSRYLFEYVENKFIQRGILIILRYFVSLRKAFIFFQNGLLQNYLLFMVVGMLVCIVSVLWK